jgi:hypothetical protein
MFERQGRFAGLRKSKQNEAILPTFFERGVSRDRVIATRLGFFITVLCGLVTIVALCRWLKWW